MFKFQNEHKKFADDFVILTFHHSRDPDRERTLASIQPKITNLVKNQWKIEKFPFPILMDANFKSETAWGVSGYPTAFLIDPEGKLVAQGHSGVEEKLAEELNKRPAPNEGKKSPREP